MSNLTPGRNEPCPCGSGRKFKRCCGAVRAEEASPALPPAQSVPREIPTIVNNDGDLLVQTRSLYEVADPVSLLVEVESWRPKPQIERIPALGNRRPRTLVKTEAGRTKVLALLEDFERTPGPPGPGGMDCALIRRELGLPPGR